MGVNCEARDSSLACRGWVRREWNPDGECRPLIRLALEAELTTVKPCAIPGDGESDAGATDLADVAGAEEGLENWLLILDGDATAPVLDDEAQFVRVESRRRCHESRRLLDTSG